MKKPNIIFYFSDQQRWDTVCEKVMPNLTAMANEGSFYENSFTCQPVCGPARACLQTGVYATQNGSYVNGIALNKDIKPLAEYLNDDGYDTAYIGKWHLASQERSPNVFHCQTTAIPKDKLGGYQYFRGSDVLEFTSHGYDGFVFDENGEKLPFKGYRADCINDFAIEYVQNHSAEKPFFMFISQLEPHHQNDTDSYECPTGYEKEFKNYPLPDDLTFLSGTYEKNYPYYLGCIKSLDENLAKLCDTLKTKGLLDNTVIIYTSDHSCHFKTRNMEYKRSCHDSSIHTPLVIWGGAFNGGGKIKDLASLIDLPATILDIADIKIPESFEGISLLDKSKKREECFVQISETQVGRAIRTDRYTYSVKMGSYPQGFLKSHAKTYREAYLYDNEKDPAQKVNLINNSEYVDVKRELKARLLKCIAGVENTTPKIRKSFTTPKK